MESMKTFQDQVKNDINSVKNKITEIETQIIDMKININSKLGSEEVKDIIDKKLAIINDYKRDAENINKTVNDINL